MAAIHDLNLAAAYCHRLYALKDGVIVGRARPKSSLPPLFCGRCTRWRRRCSPDGTAPCGCSFTRPAYHKTAPGSARGRFILPASQKPGGGAVLHIDGAAGEKAVPGDQMAHDGVVFVGVDAQVGHASLTEVHTGGKQAVNRAVAGHPVDGAIGCAGAPGPSMTR